MIFRAILILLLSSSLAWGIQGEHWPKYDDYKKGWENLRTEHQELLEKLHSKIMGTNPMIGEESKKRAQEIAEIIEPLVESYRYHLGYLEQHQAHPSRHIDVNWHEKELTYLGKVFEFVKKEIDFQTLILDGNPDPTLRINMNRAEKVFSLAIHTVIWTTAVTASGGTAGFLPALAGLLGIASTSYAEHKITQRLGLPTLAKGFLRVLRLLESDPKRKRLLALNETGKSAKKRSRFFQKQINEAIIECPQHLLGPGKPSSN